MIQQKFSYSHEIVNDMLTEEVIRVFVEMAINIVNLKHKLYFMAYY